MKRKDFLKSLALVPFIKYFVSTKKEPIKNEDFEVTVFSDNKRNWFMKYPYGKVIEIKPRYHTTNLKVSKEMLKSLS